MCTKLLEEQTLKKLSCSFAFSVLLALPSSEYIKKLRLSWVTSSGKNCHQEPDIDFFLLKKVVYCRLMGLAARDLFADRGSWIGV